ncbi:MAG: acyltransferase [Anaerolineae bacterium]
MKVQQLLAVYDYPRYLVDLYIRRVQQARWRRQGVQIGFDVIWLGMPILTLTPGSALAIGDRCLICSRVSQTALGVSHPVVLRTLRPGAELHIGAGVRMSGTTICAAQRVVIGDRCVIGADVIIADTDFHALDPAARSSTTDASSAASRPVVIEADVFIGGRSIILKGIHIGRGAVVGAGSVVTMEVPPETIVAGNPARIIGDIGDISGIVTPSDQDSKVQ